MTKVRGQQKTNFTCHKYIQLFIIEGKVLCLKGTFPWLNTHLLLDNRL